MELKLNSPLNSLKKTKNPQLSTFKKLADLPLISSTLFKMLEILSKINLNNNPKKNNNKNNKPENNY